MPDKLKLNDLKNDLKALQDKKQTAKTGLEEAKKLKSSLDAAAQALKQNQKSFQDAEE